MIVYFSSQIVYSSNEVGVVGFSVDFGNVVDSVVAIGAVVGGTVVGGVVVVASVTATSVGFSVASTVSAMEVSAIGVVETFQQFFLCRQGDGYRHGFRRSIIFTG